MAVPQGTFQLMAVLAAMASIGPFLQIDAASRTITAAFASLLWFVFGFSAYQIAVGTETYSVEPLAYVGYVAGIIMAAFTINYAFGVLRDTTSSVDGPEAIKRP